MEEYISMFVYFDYSEELATYCKEHLEVQYGIGDHPDNPTHIRLDVHGLRYLFPKQAQPEVLNRRMGTSEDFFNIILLTDNARLAYASSIPYTKTVSKQS